MSDPYAALGLSLSNEQREALSFFLDDLYDRNKVMNLTRIPQEEAELRHVVDSLLISSLTPSGASVLDLGTGPGLPAFPLAVARPDLEVTAVDSSGKMLGFLRRHPLPNLEVIQARAEEFGRRERFDVVTGRAVAPLAVQLELSAAPAKVGGRVIPFRTPAERAAVEAFDGSVLGLELDSIVEKELPGTDIVRLFPVFVKLRPTRRDYPRPWALIKAHPLGN